MLDLLKKVAVEAGRLAMTRRVEMKADAVHTKATPTDLVTDVDREVEQFIRRELMKATPEFGIYGEEFGKENADAEWSYCIDPIDGTVSYVHDTQIWTVSIGVLHRGVPYAGAVYAPRLEELYTAEQGKGAALNGNPIHRSECRELSQALCSTGFACVRARLEKNNLPYLAKILPKIQSIRRCGSAAFDLCQIGCGRYDGYWEFALQPYDISAGVVIAREAGAVVTDMKGGQDFPWKGLVTGTPEIHAALLKELEGAF